MIWDVLLVLVRWLVSTRHSYNSNCLFLRLRTHWFLLPRTLNASTTAMGGMKPTGAVDPSIWHPSRQGSRHGQGPSDDVAEFTTCGSLVPVFTKPGPEIPGIRSCQSFSSGKISQFQQSQQFNKDHTVEVSAFFNFSSFGTSFWELGSRDRSKVWLYEASPQYIPVTIWLFNIAMENHHV